MSVFDKMDFPPYEFREYPKWIKLADGTEKLVATQREELAFLATVPDAMKDDPVLEEKNKLAIQVTEQAAELAALKDQVAQLLATKGPAEVADPTAKAPEKPAVPLAAKK